MGIQSRRCAQLFTSTLALLAVKITLNIVSRKTRMNVTSSN
jgi:hypothetical protein